MKILLFLSLILFNVPVNKPLHRKQELTPVTENALYEVLKTSHVSVFGKDASEKRSATAWAQVALENGQGAKIYNFNLGMIGGSKKKPYFFINGYRFKANDSLYDGGVLYWNTIKNMCPSVLPHFDVGDVKGAAYQLYRCGYYRANKDDYARGMSKLYWKAIKGI